MRFTIDVDCGGTFTDAFVSRDDEFDLIKVRTTPHDLTVCFWDAIEETARKSGISPTELLARTEVVRFSTTIGTNTIIQKSGPRLGLLVTRGHAAGLYLDEGDAARVRDFVFPEMVAEIEEEVDAGGRVVRAPDSAAVLREVERLLDLGARWIVVCLRNGARNPANELALKGFLVKEYPRHYLGAVPLLLASQVSSAVADGERLATAVMNAYIHPDMSRFLHKADEQLRRHRFHRPLLVGHASGGVARVAKTKALQTYNSGPAAGVLGAIQVARDYQLANLVTADMGGTSLDMGLVRLGEPMSGIHAEIGGLECRLLAFAVETFGSGGGSIATAGGDGAVRVGPRSAGSVPGPAAFGLGGTEPTVTDADVVLGLINPDYFLGGRMKLDRQKAGAALERLGGQLGVDAAQAAWRVKTRVEADIGRELKSYLARQGVAAGDCTLLVYGGAGPTHGCGFAEAAGMDKILIYPYSPVFSAYGLSTADVAHLYERARWGPDPLAEMRKMALRDMRGEGFAPEAVAFALELHLTGGGREVMEIDFTDAASLRETSRRVEDRLGAVELAVLRASGHVPHWRGGQFPGGGADPREAWKEEREVYWDGRPLSAAVYDRAKLVPGNVVAGPAVIEASDTTYVLPRGWTLTVDTQNTCVLERK